MLLFDAAGDDGFGTRHASVAKMGRADGFRRRINVLPLKPTVRDGAEVDVDDGGWCCTAPFFRNVDDGVDNDAAADAAADDVEKETGGRRARSAGRNDPLLAAAADFVLLLLLLLDSFWRAGFIAGGGNCSGDGDGDGDADEEAVVDGDEGAFDDDGDDGGDDDDAKKGGVEDRMPAMLTVLSVPMPVLVPARLFRLRARRARVDSAALAVAVVVVMLC